jgi:cytochrome c556
MPRIAVIVSIVLATGTMVFAQESRPAPGGRAGRPTVPTSLGAAMRDMGQVAKRLSTEASDPATKDAAMADVILLERDIGIAKTGMPDNVRSLSGDAQAKALGEFRGMMSKLLRDVMSLEDAIDAGKADDVKTAFALIGADEKAGHEKFRTE